MEPRPQVGFGVIIVKGTKILLGKRINSHGGNTWCPPGGHLEFAESLEAGALRETLEEAGIKIKNIRKSIYTNDIFKEENRHYITLQLVADYDSGEPQILEPNKCAQWQWFEWNNLPSPLFLSLENAIKEGFSPFDY